MGLKPTKCHPELVSGYPNISILLDAEINSA
jgi:hypothetical protein